LILWRADTGEKLWERLSTDVTKYSAISPTDRSVVVECEGSPNLSRVFHVLDSANGHDRFAPVTIDDTEPVHAGGHLPVFSADGCLLAITTSSEVDVVDVASGKRLTHFERLTWEEPLPVAFTDDGSKIALRITDSNAELYALGTGHMVSGGLRRLVWRHKFAPRWDRFPADGIASREGEVTTVPMLSLRSVGDWVRDDETKPVRLFEPRPTSNWAFSPDRQIFAIRAGVEGENNTLIWRVDPKEVSAER
jgi:hypothetical protein